MAAAVHKHTCGVAFGGVGVLDIGHQMDKRRIQCRRGIQQINLPFYMLFTSTTSHRGFMPSAASLRL